MVPIPSFICAQVTSNKSLAQMKFVRVPILAVPILPSQLDAWSKNLSRVSKKLMRRTLRPGSNICFPGSYVEARIERCLSLARNAKKTITNHSQTFQVG